MVAITQQVQQVHDLAAKTDYLLMEQEKNSVAGADNSQVLRVFKDIPNRELTLINQLALLISILTSDSGLPTKMRRVELRCDQSSSLNSV